MTETFQIRVSRKEFLQLPLEIRRRVLAEHAQALEAGRPGSPFRVQLSRNRGYRMPPNTVKVARPTKWGNPFKVGSELVGYGGANRVTIDRELAVRLFECHTARSLPLEELRGKNLACFCPLDEPCHADVLLRLANAQGSATREDGR